MSKHMVRSILGSVACIAAGCAADAEAPDVHDHEEHAGRECTGVEVTPSSLAGTLTIDPAAGLATAAITNHGKAPAVVEVALHGASERGDTRTSAPAIVIGAGATEVVRLPYTAHAGFPAQLKAELVLRGATGRIVERAFVYPHTEGVLATAAERLGIPLVEDVDGEPVALGAVAPGGVGVTFADEVEVLDSEQPTAVPLVIAAGFTYNMCFRWPVSLVDAGYGEDYGTDPTSPWVARGGRVTIYQGNKKLFDGWLNGSGCTGSFWAPSSTNFSVFGYSRARINDNEIVARDDQGLTRSFVIWDADPGANTNPTYVFPEVESVSTMLAVSAYTLAKFHSGMTNRTIPVENRCNPAGNQCCNCASDGALWISDADRKFLIAHEMGHRLLSLYAGGYNNDTSYDLDPNDNMTCDLPANISHGMWSLEFESGAAMEGWAHFIAVATFNDRSGTNPGAIIQYWSGDDGTTVDVEQGPTGGASNYFDNVCPGVAIATRLGVELDWMRHWWDYYSNDTDVDPGARPSVSQMMSEIDAAPAWGPGTAWANLRAGVKTKSGATQQARWDQHGAWNGID